MTSTYTARLTVISCGVCEIPFAVPDNLYYWRTRDGESFYCPNGHRISYADNENARLKRQLAETEERANRNRADYNEERLAHEHTTHQLHGTKGALVKTKRRISRGVCPCCTRTFSNLQRHIEHMHPDYVKTNA